MWPPPSRPFSGKDRHRDRLSPLVVYATTQNKIVFGKQVEAQREASSGGNNPTLTPKALAQTGNFMPMPKAGGS